MINGPWHLWLVSLMGFMCSAWCSGRQGQESVESQEPHDSASSFSLQLADHKMIYGDEPSNCASFNDRNLPLPLAKKESLLNVNMSRMFKAMRHFRWIWHHLPPSKRKVWNPREVLSISVGKTELAGSDSRRQQHMSKGWIYAAEWHGRVLSRLSGPYQCKEYCSLECVVL